MRRIRIVIFFAPHPFCRRFLRTCAVVLWCLKDPWYTMEGLGVLNGSVSSHVGQLLSVASRATSRVWD